MLIRVAVLNAFVWTIAGAPMPGSWPSLAPEPTAESFEAAARSARAESPVDGRSRDFTAMIDISPTGTHCGGGVRMSATSAPESKYFVEGLSGLRRGEHAMDRRSELGGGEGL